MIFPGDLALPGQRAPRSADADAQRGGGFTHHTAGNLEGHGRECMQRSEAPGVPGGGWAGGRAGGGTPPWNLLVKVIRGGLSRAVGVKRVGKLWDPN